MRPRRRYRLVDDGIGGMPVAQKLRQRDGKQRTNFVGRGARGQLGNDAFAERASPHGRVADVLCCLTQAASIGGHDLGEGPVE